MNPTKEDQMSHWAEFAPGIFLVGTIRSNYSGLKIMKSAWERTSFQ